MFAKVLELAIVIIGCLLISRSEADATIEGFVYYSCGPTQIPVSGSEVFLLNSNGTTIGTETTNSTGSFMFYGIKAGYYYINLADSPLYVPFEDELGFQIGSFDTYVPVEYPVAGIIQLTVPPAVSLQCSQQTLENPCTIPQAYSPCNDEIHMENYQTQSGSCPILVTCTWTAASEYCDASTGTQLVTLVDTVAPSLTVPPDVNVQCPSSTSPSTTGTATATDNCSTPVITYSDQTSGNQCQETIVRTWQATDACYNSAMGVQMIAVADISSPMFTSVPEDTTTECTNTSPQ
jgi:hypothetical protein